MFYSECSESVHDRFETCTLDCIQTCAQISLWYDWLWTQIHSCWRCESVRLHRFRLARQCSGLEEYIRALLQYGFYNDFMIQQETKSCGIEYHRRRVYCYK